MGELSENAEKTEVRSEQSKGLVLDIKPRSELLDAEKKRDYTFIVGRPGSGKSWLVKNELLKLYPRVIVLDMLGEYDGLVINDINTLFEYVNKHKIFRIVVNELDKQKIDTILELAWYFGKICIVIEEANLWFPSRGSLSLVQSHVINRSRHRAVSLIFITQRYRRIHIDCRAAYVDMYIFQTSNKKDLMELESDTGEDFAGIQEFLTGQYLHVES